MKEATKIELLGFLYKRQRQIEEEFDKFLYEINNKEVEDYISNSIILNLKALVEVKNSIDILEKLK